MTCPDLEVLQRLAVGLVSDQEAEGLENHVLECNSCLEVLKNADPSDVLVAALSNQTAKDGQATEEEAEIAERLISRLKSLPFETDGEVEVEKSPGEPETVDGSLPSSWPVIPGYEILDQLGRGGMGVVYKARHIKLNRVVALKMILTGTHAGPEELARFQREAEAVAQLQHPNIVQIYEIGEHGGLPYLALELVDGRSLAEAVGSGQWAVGSQDGNRRAAVLMIAVARAVQHAHSRGIIHRDLKPANILLQNPTTEAQRHREERREPPLDSLSTFSLCLGASVVNSLPKIADFGLAKRLDAETCTTLSGMIIGTPSYMAPEQAAGKPKEVGPAADIYSLGAILYELLTGRPPFKADTPLKTAMQLVHEPVVPPSQLQPHVPRDLEAVCLKCLEKVPARRYTSAEALAQDLECFLAGQRISVRPTRRKRLGLIAAAVVVLALLPVVYFFGDRIVRFANGREQRNEPSTAVADTNRQVAEWVFSYKGHVRLAGDNDHQITSVAELPTAPFVVTEVSLNAADVADADLTRLEGLTGLESLGLSSTQVTDKGLAHLKNRKNLSKLVLNYTAVTDAGLEQLKDHVNLSYLALIGTRVTDAGLVHLKKLTNLSYLGLDETQIGNDGLKHIGALTNLDQLNLRGTNVTSAGLVHFAGLTKLSEFNLSAKAVGDDGMTHLARLTQLKVLGLLDTNVSDTGLAHLGGLVYLESLGLERTRVTDAGLVHLRKMRDLRSLQLNGCTQVRDDGLRHLVGLKSLRSVNLTGANVTAKGVAMLRNALPNCDIQHKAAGKP